MVPLFRCRACGFLSTLGSEFTRVEGVRFDKDCAESHALGLEPGATWVREAIAEAKVQHDPS
jgi:hypothetical protein